METMMVSLVQEKNVLIEFGSPNIAKSFHIGHLRSLNIGRSLYNLHKFLGFDVKSINYLGDWGVQYALLGLGWQHFGNTEEYPPVPKYMTVDRLTELYVRMNKWAKTNPDIKKQAKQFLFDMENSSKNAHSQKKILDWIVFREISLTSIIKFLTD
jgi:arginyl-tRNA synthetase